MIFYGVRGDAKEVVRFEGEACENCGNTTYAFIRQNQYFHIWFIPIFPVSVLKLFVCTHCENSIKHKNITTYSKEKFDEFKIKNIFPFHHFIGLAVIIFIIISINISSAQIEKNELLYIEKPQANDIYYVKFREILKNPQDEYFSYDEVKTMLSDNDKEIDLLSMQVHSIDTENIWFMMGDYIGSDVGIIEKNVIYTDEYVFPISRDVIKDYYEEDFIEKIER